MHLSLLKKNWNCFKLALSFCIPISNTWHFQLYHNVIITCCIFHFSHFIRSLWHLNMVSICNVNASGRLQRVEDLQMHFIEVSLVGSRVREEWRQSKCSSFAEITRHSRCSTKAFWPVVTPGKFWIAEEINCKIKRGTKVHMKEKTYSYWVRYKPGSLNLQPGSFNTAEIEHAFTDCIYQTALPGKMILLHEMVSLLLSLDKK